MATRLEVIEHFDELPAAIFDLIKDHSFQLGHDVVILSPSMRTTPRSR